jgi:hypothetical protein
MNGPLLSSERNQVFAWIKKSGLNPAEFTWSEQSADHGSVPALKLTHTPTGFWYLFKNHDGKHSFTRLPGKKGVGMAGDGGLVGKWANGRLTYGQEYFVKQWLKMVATEASQSDPWGDMLDRPAVGVAYEFTDNPHFTPAERTQLVQHLTQVKIYLVSLTANDPQKLTQIEAKLDYLIDSTDRFGKKDWQMVALGVFLNLAQALALSPEQFRHLFELLKTVGLFLLKA